MIGSERAKTSTALLEVSQPNMKSHLLPLTSPLDFPNTFAGFPRFSYQKSHATFSLFFVSRRIGRLRASSAVTERIDPPRNHRYCQQKAQQSFNIFPEHYSFINTCTQQAKHYHYLRTPSNSRVGAPSGPT
nr:hypothetical protein CFP56_58135 [Quercus suber]